MKLTRYPQSSQIILLLACECGGHRAMAANDACCEPFSMRRKRSESLQEFLYLVLVNWSVVKPPTLVLAHVDIEVITEYILWRQYSKWRWCHHLLIWHVTVILTGFPVKTVTVQNHTLCYLSGNINVKSYQFSWTCTAALWGYSKPFNVP